MASSAKVFKTGGSQAVRIPKEYRLETETVLVDRLGESLLIRPATPARKRARGTASSTQRPRQPGFLKGLKVPRNFDAPLPARLLRDFGQP